MDNFYNNAIYPSTKLIKKYKKSSSIKDLKELLYYVWDKTKLKALVKKGIKIEVYLGEYDKITDTKHVLEFFRDFATIYFLNKKGHTLWI